MMSKLYSEAHPHEKLISRNVCGDLGYKNYMQIIHITVCIILLVRLRLRLSFHYFLGLC